MTHDLTKGAIAPQLIKFTVPLILGNLFQLTYNAVDAAIVGTHIMLAVHDLGLGSTWGADFHPGKGGQAFNLPGGVEPVAVFPIGHPAPDSRPSPQHDKRKRIKELVTYETF